MPSILELNRITKRDVAVKEKQALTTGDVARFCGVNFRTVIRWIERGHLEAYKLPGRGDNRIPVAGFISFLQRNNMPVPDELLHGGHRLLLLTANEDFSAELAACVRKAGWDCLLLNDPLLFGYRLAELQPAALVVTSASAKDSVARLLRDTEQRDRLLLVISEDIESGSCPESWHCFQWPRDQQALLALLSDSSAS